VNVSVVSVSDVRVCGRVCVCVSVCMWECGSVYVEVCICV